MPSAGLRVCGPKVWGLPQRSCQMACAGIDLALARLICTVGNACLAIGVRLHFVVAALAAARTDACVPSQ